MTKLFTVLAFSLLLSIRANAQSIDSLLLSGKEVPDGYSSTNTNNCISVQACTLYQDPEMYGALIGKLKAKRIQNFDSKKDKGAVMYFEFDGGFKGAGFLDGLLWGVDKPTKEHPEEYYSKGNFMVIWSFKKGSVITKASKDKLMAMLK